MDSDKTLIVIDTNQARSVLNDSPRYDRFDFGREFITLRMFIEENDLLDTATLEITEMTLKELLKQKEKVYDNDKANLRSAISRLRHLENVSIPDIVLPEDSFDCMKYLAPKVEKFLEENKVLIIKIQDTNKAPMLDALIQNVIDVRLPFKTTGKDNTCSGQGFKDAVIWETLIHHITATNYT